MKNFITIKKIQFYHLDFDLKKKLTLLFVFLSISQVQSHVLNVTGVTKQKTEQQQRVISGQVTDENGMPLPGASVFVKNTKNSAMTDFDGKFTLKINEGDKILVVSFVGYESTEVLIQNKSVFEINVKPSSEGLKEVVVVGFGTQKKASMVSSITTINPKELKGPTGNLTTMLAGRVAGMIAYQTSGEPGQDNANFFIRGLGTFGSGKQNPLILIDGIESSATDMARLQPDDIEAFSVLKDAAAAAVYGARGANGVVLITTKMGKEGVTKFNLRTESRVSSNLRNFKFADNVTYMNLANEAALTRNPSAALPYDRNKIDRTAAGDNPLLYPSNNWLDELIKDYTVNQGFNLSISGGGQKARYYIASTYNIDNGVLDVEGLNNFNSNIKLRNYSIRSNVDMDLTPTTKGIFRVYGQFDDYNGPVGGGGRIFNLALWSNPVKFAKVYPSELLPFIEHPLFGGAPTGANSNTLLINPYAEMVSGYQTSKASTIQTQIELKQDFKFITEGLSARAMGYVRRYSFYDESRRYSPFYYQPNIDIETGELNLKVLNPGGQGSIGNPGRESLTYSPGNKILDSRIYLETAINYNRTFNEKHAVSGMLINLLSSYEQADSRWFSNDVARTLPSRNHGVSGRFTYAYDDRYLTEFNFGYNGSERFAKGNRYGFFPSMGLAYHISNEKFWEPIKGVITDMKIRSTFGLVGNDQIGDVSQRFFYLSDVTIGNGAYGASFGEQNEYGQPGVSINRYANNNIGWEESTQVNLGLDVELFRSLNITADVFKQNRKNILQNRSNIGATMGLTSSPATNFGKVESKGLDLMVTYNKQFNTDWYAQLRSNFTYATNEFVEFDEVNYPADLSYRSRIGQNVNQVWGYIAERLFVDSEEVANSPTQFGDYSGGDIKYRDVNGDGVISENDMVPLGNPTVPEIVYGFGGTVGYKQFDFSIFFQGSARSTFFINPWNIAPFVLTGQAQNGLLDIIAEDHWSEDNRDLYAFWPRLSDKFVENNNQTSSWWMRNGDFLRLKSIEAGYNVPEKVTSKMGIKSLRVYFSGNNLAVWSKFKLWDPEMGGNGLGYPIQSVYNLGLKIDF